jgi:hypothetical protein
MASLEVKDKFGNTSSQSPFCKTESALAITSILSEAISDTNDVT